MKYLYAKDDPRYLSGEYVILGQSSKNLRCCLKANGTCA